MKLLFNYTVRLALIVISTTAGINSLKAQLPDGYIGVPYSDSVYMGNKLNPVGAQMIPGRVELAYYDLGGEGGANEHALRLP